MELLPKPQSKMPSHVLFCYMNLLRLISTKWRLRDHQSVSTMISMISREFTILMRKEPQEHWNYFGISLQLHQDLLKIF